EDINDQEPLVYDVHSGGDENEVREENEVNEKYRCVNGTDDDDNIKYPPGFTPDGGNRDSHLCEENFSSINGEEVQQGNEGEIPGIQNGSRSMNGTNSQVSGSVGSRKFKKSVVPKTGGSMLCLMEELVWVGQAMGYNMEGCLAQKAKKDWVKELCIKNKVNFLAIQETKMESIDLISVKLCWGNLRFDHVHSDSVGNSGGILCVWDSDSFRKDSVTVSDYFVIIRGVWLKTNVNLLIVVVYAPHDSRDKRILWDYLVHISNQWDGEVVMMGDFNEVRCKSDRFGSVFNARGADVFNSFIAEAGLVEVSLGGSVFTWCHKSASKMSKLDRFFISDNLLNTCPNISAVTLERYLSDHRPILLRESCFDYGPVPFRFYHYWLTLDGFDKFVKVTWREAPGDKVNALRNLMFKLKHLKVRIREWVSNKRNHSQAESNRLKADLAKLDDSIDKGMGTIDIVNKRTETLNSLHKLNYLQSTEAAQKAKVKWSVEGDENGIMVDGQWIEEPGRVKNQFLQHFRDRFAAPDDDRIHIDMPQKPLSCSMAVDLKHSKPDCTPARTITVIDDLLNVDPHLSSQSLRNAQGVYITISSADGSRKMMTFTAMMEDGEYGDSINFFGVYHIGSAMSRLSITGDTCMYLHACGFAEVWSLIPAGQIVADGVESLLRLTVHLSY
ncbi:RNA-directed DNA polymerase, eukaryota, partial [Tanacetum coccineum]